MVGASCAPLSAPIGRGGGSVGCRRQLSAAGGGSVIEEAGGDVADLAAVGPLTGGPLALSSGRGSLVLCAALRLREKIA